MGEGDVKPDLTGEKIDWDIIEYFGLDVNIPEDLATYRAVQEVKSNLENPVEPAAPEPAAPVAKP